MMLTNILDNMMKEMAGVGSFPFYNVAYADEKGFSFEFAVAGFGKEDIKVTVKDNILTIKGEKQSRREENAFKYRGITSKNFTRKLIIPSYTKVSGVTLKNGILTINFAYENINTEEVVIEVEA